MLYYVGVFPTISDRAQQDLAKLSFGQGDKRLGYGQFRQQLLQGT